MSDYVADFKFFIEYPNLIDYSKFFKNPIVICIIIFILALIGVGIYFIVRPKKTKPNGGGGGSGGGSGGSGGGPTGQIVTLKNYDDDAKIQESSMFYYEFISPIDNCKITNISVYANGDSNGSIICTVNLKDGSVVDGTSFTGNNMNTGSPITPTVLNHIENIPILNKGDFVGITWEANVSSTNLVFGYLTNDKNSLAVSLTYIY